MEIRDYMSQVGWEVGWRLWGLVLLPLAAGGAAFALLADTPSQYEAESILTVPSSVAGGASSSSVAQYMANFEQAIVSDGVAAHVANEVGVDKDDVQNGLQTTQQGTSNLVRVSYQGPDSDEAARIVVLSTQLAFNLVAEIQLPFGASIETLRSRARAAADELARAEDRLEDFLVETGLVLPRDQYLLVASDVARLEAEIVRARTDGTPTAALEAELAARRRELQEIGALIPKYERLQADVDSAEEDVDAAEDELRLAENQSASMRPLMTDVTTHPVPEIQTIGKGVAIAAGAGFVVAIALLLLFPSRGGRQRRYAAAQHQR